MKRKESPYRYQSPHSFSQTQRLKSALWYSIGQFVDEQGIDHNFNATPQFIGALTELAYTQIGKLPYPILPFPFFPS